jgi:rare lipoprotein A
MLRRAGPMLALALCLAACAVHPPPPPPSPPPVAAPERPTFSEEGLASWYGADHDGHVTANGETFDMQAMTAAHRTLAFNTIVRVTNLANGRMVKVRINDRGPYAKGRVIDLSAKAARALGIADGGTVRVRIERFASDQPSS